MGPNYCDHAPGRLVNMTTWPPYSRLVAATWFKSATITILDGATLTPLNGMPWRLPQNIKNGRHWLSFPPRPPLNRRGTHKPGPPDRRPDRYHPPRATRTPRLHPFSSTYCKGRRTLEIECRDFSERPTFAIATYCIQSETYIFSFRPKGEHRHPALDSWRIPSIRYCRVGVDHHLGSRVHVATNAGEGLIHVRPERVCLWGKIHVPPDPLPTCLYSPEVSVDLGCPEFKTSPVRISKRR